MVSPRTRLPSIRLLALAVLLPFAGAALAQSGAARNIEQQMTPAQFKAAGLDKLNAEQLANLNAWLQGKLEVETAKAVETAKQDIQGDKRGLDVEPSREPVSGKIAGQFDGFGKGRSFTLDNGQVWQQVDDASLSGVHLNDPVVRIAPGVIGATWYLSVEGYNKRAKVQRVK